MTWGRIYWPIWLVFTTLTFLGPEVSALTSNVDNTLSEWVWGALHVTKDHQEWTAAHFLVFGNWLVLVIWLTYHFFFRRFT